MVVDASYSKNRPSTVISAAWPRDSVGIIPILGSIPTACDVQWDDDRFNETEVVQVNYIERVKSVDATLLSFYVTSVSTLARETSHTAMTR